VDAISVSTACNSAELLYFSNTQQRENKISGLESFYLLVHEVAARLVGAHATKMDVALDDCLAKVGEYFDVSQVGLGQTSKTGELLPPLRAWGHSATTYLSAPPPGRDIV
jgi:hypothetical protein